MAFAFAGLGPVLSLGFRLMHSALPGNLERPAGPRQGLLRASSLPVVAAQVYQYLAAQDVIVLDP